MAAVVLNLNRGAYIKVGAKNDKIDTLNFLSARYQNIKYILTPQSTFIVTHEFEANAPGISYEVYGSIDYWWVVCFYNGILNPLTDLFIGRVLQLPSFADVNALLSIALNQTDDNTVTI